MAAAPNFFAPLAASGIDTADFNPLFGSRMQSLISAAQAATGGKVQITSGYRSPEHQAQIYANYTQKPINYGGTTYTPNGTSGIAAPPGKSEHQSGTAMDIQPSGSAYAWMVKNAPKFGVESGSTWGGSQYDPPHFQLPRSEMAQALAGQAAPAPAADPATPAGMPQSTPVAPAAPAAPGALPMASSASGGPPAPLNLTAPDAAAPRDSTNSMAAAYPMLMAAMSSFGSGPITKAVQSTFPMMMAAGQTPFGGQYAA